MKKEVFFENTSFLDPALQADKVADVIKLFNVRSALCGMRLHSLDLLLGDVKSQLALSLGKRNPQLSPSREFNISGENVLHFLACVSDTKGIYINIIHSL